MISFDHNREVPVMEHFYTLQGEGAHTGKAAYFIRLAGCDVGCVWCDVKESWEAQANQLVLLGQLREEVENSPAEIVVVTGGEPLMYDCLPLTSEIKKTSKRIHVETSGAYPVSGKWDWICLSPKKFKQPDQSILPFVDELKIIVYNKSDFSWAEEWAALMPDKTLLFLQPEWSREKEMAPLIVDYVKNHPKWQVSLQTHKYLDIP